MSSNTGLQQSAVPAKLQTSPDPAFFSPSDPTHYRQYIYYHMTTPYQPSQEAQNSGEVRQTLILREGGAWERDLPKVTVVSVPRSMY